MYYYIYLCCRFHRPWSVPSSRYSTDTPDWGRAESCITASLAWRSVSNAARRGRVYFQGTAPCDVPCSSARSLREKSRCNVRKTTRSACAIMYICIYRSVWESQTLPRLGSETVPSQLGQWMVSYRPFHWSLCDRRHLVTTTMWRHYRRLSVRVVSTNIRSSAPSKRTTRNYAWQVMIRIALASFKFCISSDFTRSTFTALSQIPHCAV